MRSRENWLAYQQLLREDKMHHSGEDKALEHPLFEDVKNKETVEQTLSARRQTHGKFIDNGYIMQELKDACRTREGWTALLPYQREALDMICHKMGRILSGNPNEPDHWHDIAGYATLVEKILGGEDR